MKNISNTIGNLKANFRFVAQCLNQLHHHVPLEESVGTCITRWPVFRVAQLSGVRTQQLYITTVGRAWNITHSSWRLHLNNSIKASQRSRDEHNQHARCCIRFDFCFTQRIANILLALQSCGSQTVARPFMICRKLEICSLSPCDYSRG